MSGQMQSANSGDNQGKLSLRKVAAYAGLAVGAIALVCVLVLLCFPDVFLNRFLKDRITRAQAEAYPAFSVHIANLDCNVWENRMTCDSVALTTSDSTLSCTVATFSVSGIRWIHLLFGGSLAPNDLSNFVVDAQGILLNAPQSQYELRCGMLRLSVPDSEMAVEALTLHPSGDDEQFFAVSKFRRTRFRLVVPRARLMGLECLALLQGQSYSAHSAQMNDTFIDVLINKDKPSAIDTSRTLMPNEILSSMKGNLQVDSVRIMDGQLKYGERFAVGAKPALITFENMRVLAEGIANHRDRYAASVIHAQGIFMKAGTMRVLMSIPVASPEFSFQYSGSLSAMDLSALNGFIEIAEQMRIKAGSLEAATFEINVVSGRAGGTVRAKYRDLTLAVLNKQTGSDKGFLNGIASLIANRIKIRRTNEADKSGSIAVGKVKYARKQDDPFFRFVWFALRSGVKDVVGF